ncbi:hypothetical protein [Acaryochloris sp. CCMEE 5410]|uniref:hypothetical protein n=1 Tax=Acaryochloris sp. CCMEE 5410 TaxID=310037 RepID=UPI0021D330B7|nr:hypothetical protein [Acaryochloris sp. CCMEE 5410]
MNWAYGKPRGDRFFALSIFAVKAAHPERTREKSWVCSIVEHGQPTSENWRNFFLGYDPIVKQKLIADFEAQANFAQGDRAQSDLDKGMPERFDAIVDDLAF